MYNISVLNPHPNNGVFWRKLMDLKNMEPMNASQYGTLVMLLTAEREDKVNFDTEIYPAFLASGEASITANIIKLRIEVLKLPKLEPSAIMVLAMFSGGNPGKAILGLVETIEDAAEKKPSLIDAKFVCDQVYPFGFYSDAEWYNVFECRKERNQEGFNWII
jgi:hypothetical protein